MRTFLLRCDNLVSKCLTGLYPLLRCFCCRHCIPRYHRFSAMHPVVDFLQQNTSVFVVLGAVATILGVAFSFYKTYHNRQLRDLRDQIRQKDRRIEILEKEGPEVLLAAESTTAEPSGESRGREQNLTSGMDHGRGNSEYPRTDWQGERGRLHETIQGWVISWRRPKRSWPTGTGSIVLVPSSCRER